jgi:glycosyltransferase involved in cell wall biosynthesis
VPFQDASGSIQWSIIVPAHNEAARILPYLRSITSYMQDRGEPYEVLVVDDGSTDATASVVETAASSAPEIQLLRAPLCQGNGPPYDEGCKPPSDDCNCLPMRTGPRRFRDSPGSNRPWRVKRETGEKSATRKMDKSIASCMNHV